MKYGKVVFFVLALALVFSCGGYQDSDAGQAGLKANRLIGAHGHSSVNDGGVLNSISFIASPSFTQLLSRADLSVNYSIGARGASLNTFGQVQLFYSKFNTSLPNGIFFYDVFATNKNQKNATPYGQSASTPIWNFTNLAYDEPLSIYVKTNATVACLNITYGNTSNKTQGFILNTSYQRLILNVTINRTNPEITSEGSWNWYDLNNCTSRFEIPYFTFVSVCRDCIQNSKDFDNFNLIVE